MTQEDKELLLKDIFSRLPYGVKVLCPDGEDAELFYEKGTLWIKYTNGFICSLEWCLEDLKLYLRPLSSMTEDERYEYLKFIIEETDDEARFLNKMVFYNKYHFDYRGLIEKGLAIEMMNK